MNLHAVFTFDEEYDGYIVEVLELPGCMSQGKTLAEAKSNIVDAVQGVLHVLAEHGEPYKPPSKPTRVLEISV
jgi:predicted RNase H-like HicB family nuclease